MDVEHMRSKEARTKEYKMFPSQNSNYLPPWMTARVTDLLSRGHSPPLSGDLGSSCGCVHNPHAVAPCSMWQAGAGCFGTIGHPCQALHDPELLCLNTCEMSKAVCQGFGCYRVTNGGAVHHDLWMEDVRNFAQEAVLSLEQQPGAPDLDMVDDNNYDGHCFMLALAKDVEASKCTPLNGHGYEQVKWFQRNFRPPYDHPHISSAGLGLATLVYHIADYELMMGPDVYSSRYRALDVYRRTQFGFLDAARDLNQRWKGTNKFKDVYSKKSPTQSPK
jgi:hypothetical protein